MFRNEAKVQNSNAWKRQNLEFQCFEKPQFKLPMIGKGKIQNSNVWKKQNLEFQSLEKANFRIQMFEKAKD